MKNGIAISIIYVCFLFMFIPRLSAESYWGEPFSADTRPGKPIPMDTSETLSPAEAHNVQNAVTNTVANIEENVPRGSDPFVEANFSNKLNGDASKPSKPVDPPMAWNNDDVSEPSKPVDPPMVRNQDLPFRGGLPQPKFKSPREKEQSMEEQLQSSIENILRFIRSRHDSRNQREDEEQAKSSAQLFDIKLEELIKEIQGNAEHFLEETNESGEQYIALEGVDFTRDFRAISRLLSPPERLHPLLKWLLYLSRVTPEMIQFYQAALEKRDDIYTIASQSNGRLRVRYQGKITDVPIYVWPEYAEGSYELVLLQSKGLAPEAVSRASIPAPTS